MIKAVARVDLSTAAHPCVSVGLIYLLIEFWGAAEQWGGYGGQFWAGDGGHCGTTAETADLWIAACKLNDLQWTQALIGAKWRYQALLYLKLITRLSIPGRPGSASRRSSLLPGGGRFQRFARQKLPSSSAVSLFSRRLVHTSNPPPHTPNPPFPVVSPAFLSQSTPTPPQAICTLICHCASDWNTSERGESRRVVMSVYSLKEQKGKIINGKLTWSAESESARGGKNLELNRSRKPSPSHRMANRWDARWCTHRISSSRGGGVMSYAFLCQGSMYSRPRWAKMSFSVVAAKNSF